MKRIFFALICVCLGLLPLTLIGCTAPAVPETDVMETALEEPETLSLLGAEILPSEEIDALKAARKRIPSGDKHAALYLNGTELACLNGRRVFYATVPQTESENGIPEGVLTGPDGYRTVIDQAHLPKDIFKLMESGNRLTICLFSETDYFVAEVILTYLPVISIDIDNEAELSHSLQGASLAVHDSASENKLKRYTESRAEVKIRGGSSSSLPKKSIRIDLKDENGDNCDQSFLGMRKDDDWILTAMFSDEDKIRDMTGWQLWREMNSLYPDVRGSCAPEMAYVEVILNGQYQGLYLFMEKFDAKTMKLEEGDVLFKAASWDVPDSAGLKRQQAASLGYKALEKKWPGIRPRVEGTWDAIAEYIRVAYETDGKGFTAGIADIASVENQLDYWIFNNITMAGDNTFKNAYYAVKNGLVYTLPWDLDISFGLNWNGDPATNYLYRDPGCVARTYDFQVGRRLIKYDDDAADYVKERWTELKEAGIVTAEHIIANAESHRNLLRSSGVLTRECARWPTVSLSETLDYFKSIVTRRILWMDDYISGLD